MQGHRRTAVADRACQFCGTPLAPKTWFCTNCGAPAIAAGSGATAAPSFPVLPGYTVLAEIAREGGTEEYRARQEILDRDVAVKLVRHAVDDPASWRRFEREARIIGALSGHPHVVTVFDVGRSATAQPFLVTELLDGGSLSGEIARKGPLGAARAIAVGRAVAAALAAAHQRGILHRDVKPDNVLLGSRGEIKLGGFGVARLMVGQSGNTTRMMTWAPEHAAPELLRGESAGTATDVYGLGSVIATALSGRSPFREGPDDRVDAMLRRKMSGSPPLLASGPNDLNALVTRCLVPEPSDRPSLDVVARELTRLQSLRAGGVEPTRTTSTATDPGDDAPDHDERVFGPVYVGALIVLLTCLLFAALFFGLG